MNSRLRIRSHEVNGGIQVFATDPRDLVIDINGYFLARPTVHFRGAWSRNTSYAPDDVVTFGGPATASYIALMASQALEPERDAASGGPHWAVLVQSGAAGPEGPPGAPGPTGLTGPAGPQGPPIAFHGTWSNLTAYAAGDAVSYSGSSYISLSSSKHR